MAELFFDSGGLLVEHHPRIKYRADQGCTQKPEIGFVKSDVDHVMRYCREIGTRCRGDQEERELERADQDRRSLDAAI